MNIFSIGANVDDSPKSESSSGDLASTDLSRERCNVVTIFLSHKLGVETIVNKITAMHAGARCIYRTRALDRNFERKKDCEIVFRRSRRCRFATEEKEEEEKKEEEVEEEAAVKAAAANARKRAAENAIQYDGVATMRSNK